MCDLAVHDFIKSENKDNLSAKVDAYVVAYNHNLVFSQCAGTDFFAEVLRDHASRRCLTFTDISTLASLIGRVDSLWVAVTDILSTIKHQVNRDLLVQETCFPILLHQAIQKEDRGLLVKNAGVDAINGNYIRIDSLNGFRQYNMKKGVWNGNEGLFVLYRVQREMPIVAWVFSFSRRKHVDPNMHDFYTAHCTLESLHSLENYPAHDFYRARCRSTHESLHSLGGYPPGQGWVLAQEGVQPFPIVTLN